MKSPTKWTEDDSIAYLKLLEDDSQYIAAAAHPLSALLETTGKIYDQLTIDIVHKKMEHMPVRAGKYLRGESDFEAWIERLNSTIVFRKRFYDHLVSLNPSDRMGLIRDLYEKRLVGMFSYQLDRAVRSREAVEGEDEDEDEDGIRSHNTPVKSLPPEPAGYQ